jgi:hypothetical protein
MSFFNSIFNILRFNKKNWKAVVLCIFAATVFWFFNALNKSYSTTISFPLSFDFDHEKYVPARPLPQAVRINVTGIGWNLFRRSAGVKIPPLVIPLDRPTDVKKIVGSTLPALFANQLGDFEINFVITDTLRVSIDQRGERKIRLKLDSPDTFLREGYTLVSPIQIIPDSIFIEGPLKVISRLSEPVYLKIQQRNIDENFRESVEVSFSDGAIITRSPSSVDVSFQVDKLVERVDSIQLKLINTPKNSWPLMGRKKVPCTLAVPQTMLNFYNIDSIRAVVDLENFRKGQVKILPSLEGLPPFTKVIELDSVFIKF